jgi:hypothetical protein
MGGQAPRLTRVLATRRTDVEEGGETVFPNADRKSTGAEFSECAKKGLAVKVKKGDAVRGALGMGGVRG